MILSSQPCGWIESCTLLEILRALGYYDFLEVNPHQKEKTVILIFGHFFQKKEKVDEEEDAY